MVRTMPVSAARLSSRETLAWEMCRVVAMSVCRMPCSWYMWATLVISRTCPSWAIDRP